MEKEMLIVAKIKEGEGKYEKFMSFMQSQEGLDERSKVTILENSPDITKYFIANIASTVSFSLAIISDEIHPGIK